ncbi:hypothetical protein, partial [Xanthomonas citri]|uniref:hypothetical protein n=1 Tax=Xanthomonas citri TaxID=346 RepID=UPI001C1F95E6
GRGARAVEDKNGAAGPLPHRVGHQVAAMQAMKRQRETARSLTVISTIRCGSAPKATCKTAGGQVRTGDAL